MSRWFQGFVFIFIHKSSQDNDKSCQGRCHQKSKTGVSVAPQKGLVSYKNLLEKKW